MKEEFKVYWAPATLLHDCTRGHRKKHRNNVSKYDTSHRAKAVLSRENHRSCSFVAQSLASSESSARVVAKDTIELMNKSPQNFERLVLICIDSYDSEKGRILQHFSRSTRFAFLCTAQISNFQQKTSWFFLHFFEKFRENFQNFVIFQQNFDEFCPEFHETFSNFLRKRRKCWFAGNFLIFAKFADISGIAGKVHSFISSVQSYP